MTRAPGRRSLEYRRCRTATMSRKPSRPSDAELRLVAPVSAVDSRHGGSRRAGALLVCRSPNVRQLAAGRRPRAARRCSVEAVRSAFGSEGCGGGTVWLWVRPLSIPMPSMPSRQEVGKTRRPAMTTSSATLRPVRRASPECRLCRASNAAARSGHLPRLRGGASGGARRHPQTQPSPVARQRILHCDGPMSCQTRLRRYASRSVVRLAGA